MHTNAAHFDPITIIDLWVNLLSFLLVFSVCSVALFWGGVSWICEQLQTVEKVLLITVTNCTSLQLRPEFTEIVSDMDNLPQMTVGKGEGTYNVYWMSLIATSPCS